MSYQMPVGLMELPTEDELKERTAGGKLPCADISSDHIALMAEFMFECALLCSNYHGRAHSWPASGSNTILMLQLRPPF
eukprot:scaffold678061_cov43-Prasinocladus_malaysianus.AAC.1